MTKMIPLDSRGYQLLHDGALALAKAERHGVVVDVDYCRSKLSHLERQSERLTRKILAEPEVRLWKNKYKRKFNLTSGEQLENILYRELGLKPPKRTESAGDDENGKGSVDQESLSQIDLPFVKLLLEQRKIKTAQDDLGGILREQVNGLLHPNYTLHFADTYRSSCRDPNLQNMPVRDPVLGKTIRRAFTPRPGNMLLEVDYGGIEVHGACWYHLDPTMMEYLSNPEKDMHRDMAAQIYMLEDAPAAYWKDGKTGKIVRYCGKNKYVFPEFYGSYYIECAKNLWRSIREMSLVDPNGRSLYEHLKSKGTRTEAQFEKHLKWVEDDFWGRRFKVYAKWKDQWYNKYVERGYFDTLSGFRCQGVLRRNQVINYPVQGTAFHCLLWSLTRVTNELERLGLLSRIILQIHDSLILDVVPSELDQVMEIVHRVMVDELKAHWDFIVTPIEIESEIAPVGTTWHDKRLAVKENYDCNCTEWAVLSGKDYLCPTCGKTGVNIPF